MGVFCALTDIRMSQMLSELHDFGRSVKTMSRMLSLLNRLKAEANRNMLTKSQLDAFHEAEKLWRFPERINLWGPNGCGKTFLGWAVARSLRAAFFPSPFALRTHGFTIEQYVVVDNVSSGQMTLREVLAELQLRNISHALLITTQPSSIGLLEISLSTPTAQDIDMVYRNLSLLERYALTPLRSGNLWEVVYSVL